MALSPVVQLSCSFKVVKCEPLTPFVWGILEVISTFPQKPRPEFEVIAEKLSVLEPSFFKQGWDEAVVNRLVDSSYYQSTQLTDKGKSALKHGFIMAENPKVRSEVLCFFAGNGQVVEWKDSYSAKHHRKADCPTWADKLNGEKVCKAINTQLKEEELHIKPGEKIFDLCLDWETAQIVKLD